MYRGLKPLAAVAVAAFCLVLSISWVWAQDKLDKDYKQTARRQEEAKKQLQHLEEVMQELAKKIEKKQPDEAKKLREAWKAVREKLLLEDMDAIQKALQKGQGFEAFNKSKKVVQNLIELLNYLIGKQYEKKDVEGELKELKKHIEEIRKLERDEKNLLDKTQSVSKIEERLKNIEKALEEIERLAQEQNNLMKNPAREGQDLIVFQAFLAP